MIIRSLQNGQKTEAVGNATVKKNQHSSRPWKKIAGIKISAAYHKQGERGKKKAVLFS